MTNHYLCIQSSFAVISPPLPFPKYYSKGLQDGPLELTKLRDTIKLTVTCDGKTLDFDLLEMPATVCREESQLLLFSVWDSLEATKAKLTQAGEQEYV